MARILTQVWVVALLGAVCPQLVVGATGRSPQSAPPQDQAARIDQILAECRELGRRGRLDDLASRAEEAFKLSQALGDKDRMTRALNQLGLAHMNRGRSEEALEAFARMAALAGEAGSREGQAHALNNRGLVMKNTGR